MDDEHVFSVEKHSGCLPKNERHFHLHYELYYLVQGKTGYFIENNLYDITEGTLIIIPPNTLHKTIPAEQSYRTRILLNLKPEFIKEFSHMDSPFPGKPRIAFYKIEKNDRISRIFYELLEEYEKNKSALMQKALICELIVLLSRAETADTITVSDTAKIFSVICLVNAEYTSDISLFSAAKHFGMNASYLSREFKAYTGFTFSEYLQKLRISKAVELLSQSEKNVTEIAMATGFNSCNHFCKTFKKIMGVPPKAYKKRFLQSKPKTLSAPALTF